MKSVRLFIEVVFVLLLAAGFIGAAFQFPANPTLNQEVTGPAGQIFKWDGTKWVTPGAAMLPTNNPGFTGTMQGPNLSINTSATLPNTTITRVGVNRPVPSVNGNLDISNQFLINGLSQLDVGTWQPTQRCGTGANPNQNPINDMGAQGQYVRVGPMVYVLGFGHWGTSHGGGTFGYIGGLPSTAWGLAGAIYHMDIMSTNAVVTYPNLRNTANELHGNGNWNLGARMLAGIQPGTNVVTVWQTDFGPHGVLIQLGCNPGMYSNAPSGFYLSGWYRDRASFGSVN